MCCIVPNITLSLFQKLKVENGKRAEKFNSRSAYYLELITYNYHQTLIYFL
jgi:hypothetical protein